MLIINPRKVISQAPGYWTCNQLFSSSVHTGLAKKEPITKCLTWILITTNVIKPDCLSATSNIISRTQKNIFILTLYQKTISGSWKPGIKQVDGTEPGAGCSFVFPYNAFNGPFQQVWSSSGLCGYGLFLSHRSITDNQENHSEEQYNQNSTLSTL